MTTDSKLETLMELATDVLGIQDPRTCDGESDSDTDADNVAPDDEEPMKAPEEPADDAPDEEPEARPRIKIRGKTEIKKVDLKPKRKARTRVLTDAQKELGRQRARIRYYVKKGLTEAAAKEIIAQRDLARVAQTTRAKPPAEAKQETKPARDIEQDVPEKKEKTPESPEKKRAPEPALNKAPVRPTKYISPWARARLRTSG